MALAPLTAACGASSGAQAPAAGRVGADRVAGLAPGAASTRSAATSTSTTAAVPSTPAVRAPGALGPSFSPVATVGGEPAAWAARRGGATLLRLDQRLVHLALHAGSEEPGEGRWRYGSEIGRSEAARVVAGFNGGFKLSYGSVGFMADGRVAVPLSAGLASIVTYRDGTTQIGDWREGVPVAGHGGVEAVLQNQHLLVANGTPAANVTSCAIECWGATLGGGAEVARSALGITGDGELVWAAGEHLSPAQLAGALVGAGAQRAVELDINPEWVAGYVYLHGSARLAPVPLVPEQPGIPGQLLAPYSRDFFTVLAY